MKDRLTDLVALAGLVFLGWVILTRFYVVYDSTVCWTSCG